MFDFADWVSGQMFWICHRQILRPCCLSPAGPGRAERCPSGRKLAHWLMAVSMLICLAGVGWQALVPGAGIKGHPVSQGGLASGHTRQAVQSGWQSLKEAGLLTQAFMASQQAAEAARETICNNQQQLAAVCAGLQAQAFQVKASAPCSPVNMHIRTGLRK